MNCVLTAKCSPQRCQPQHLGISGPREPNASITNDRSLMYWFKGSLSNVRTRAKLIDDTLVASLDSVVAAVRLLIQSNRVIAEGAGATPVACALSGEAGAGKIVCVVSGGNIDTEKLVKILGS